MIKDFLEKNYCPKNCDELFQKECREGVRIRCSDFEEREKLLEDFAGQENKELREELKDANEKVVHLACNQNKDLKYKLTKAKEILRGLYFIIQYRIDYKNNIGIADEMWRAEQFLKEIEK